MPGGAALLRALRARRSTDDGVVRFLLTAGAIGVLYKENASISGAEVGCQGEVGVGVLDGRRRGSPRCSAARPEQVENAAEIGMEHHLGPDLRPRRRPRADPLHRAQRHRRGQGDHRGAAWRCAATATTTSRLDKAIRTMRETGADMATKYKETARGGLAAQRRRVLGGVAS